VIPESVEVSLALLKTPVVFIGSGFKPGEYIAIELVVDGLEMPGKGPEEDAVGIAFATANEYGAFKATMGTLSKIFWVLRGDYSLATGKPSFPRPFIPPGVYTIRATGFDSNYVATTPWELKAPPKKKE